MRARHKASNEEVEATLLDGVIWEVEYIDTGFSYSYSRDEFFKWFEPLSEEPQAMYTLKLDTDGKVAGIANDDRDNVNSPKHYTRGHVETIYAIENVLGPEGFKAYCMGNYMKYMARHQHKNGEEDLKKAQVYLNWLTNGLPAPVNGKLPKE